MKIEIDGGLREGHPQGTPQPPPESSMRSRSFAIPILLVILALSGCEFVANFISGPADEQLVEEALARWVQPGRPFMEGAFGADTVGTVTETGERTWEATVGSTTYALEVTRAHVYPVYASEVFTRWISDKARALGFRTFVPEDVQSLVSSGRIVAVGDLEVSFGDASRGGRSTWERVGYLRANESHDQTWSIQPEVRSATVLLGALQTVYDDLMFTDDRVMDCLGSANPGTVEKSRVLNCIGEVLELEYGEGPG